MQQRLVRALPTATTVAQAGEIAGYGTRQSTYRAMKSIRRNAVDILDEIGYGQVKAIQDLREMADRKVVKHFANKGVVMDSKTDEDHQAGHTPRPEEHPPQCGGERTQFPTLPHLSAVLLPVAQIGEFGITFGCLYPPHLTRIFFKFPNKLLEPRVADAKLLGPCQAAWPMNAQTAC